MPVDPRLFRPFSLAEAYQAGDVHQARQQAIAATGAQQAAMGAQPGGLQGYYGQQISQQQQDRQMKMFKDLGGHKSKTAVDWYNKQGMAQEFGPITYEEPEAKKQAGRVEQGIDLGTLAASKQFQEELTPEQQAEVGIPAAQQKLFAAGGAAGKTLLSGTQAAAGAERYAPADLKRFEAMSPFTAADRGTPAYIKAIVAFNKLQAERKLEWTGKETAMMTRIVDKYNADPSIRKAEQMVGFGDLIVSVAESDNPIGHSSLATLMSRASGEVGNLSEADKRPFGGSKELWVRMQQVFTELYSGQKTPENLQFIADLAETFKQSGAKRKVRLARKRAAQYSRANKRFSEREVFESLAPFSIYETEEESAPGGAPRTVVQKGTQDGHKVVKYSDGSVEYAE